MSLMPRRARLILSIGALIVLAGCGYRWVGPGDTPPLRLGTVDDLTPHGDLGLVARAHLRRRARIIDGAAFELRGRVRPGADTPLAIGADGERVRSVGVVVELAVHDAAGRPVVLSGPVARSRPLLLSAEPAGADRRRQLDVALEEALDDALDRILARWPAGDAT